MTIGTFNVDGCDGNNSLNYVEIIKE